MAAKVNTKFVAILVGVLVLMAGGVGAAAYMVLFKSASDFVKQGDALMKAGKPLDAEKVYGKAVSKEPTNIEYLRKWRESLEKMAPATQTLFDAKYPQYTIVRKKIADLQRTDTKAHRDHLDVYLQTIQNAGYSRQFCEALAQAATDALAQYGDGKSGFGEGEELRRYRALANLKILLESKNLKDADDQQIKADFDAALAADPGDVDSVLGLHAWYVYHADAAMNNQRPDEGIKLAEQGREVVRAFSAKAPKEPRTKVTSMGWLLADARRRAAAMNKIEDRRKVAEQLKQEGRAALDEAGALLLELPPDQIDAQTVSQFTFMELQLDDSGKLDRSRKVLDRCLASRPEDAALLINKSEAEALSRDYDGAINTLQKVRDLPNPALSVAGRLLWYRKNEALFRQATLALKALEQSSDPDPAKEKQLRAAWLEKAKIRRAELAKIDPDTSARMLFVDGKIKLAEEDYQNAQRLLLSYLSLVNEADQDGLFAAANASFRLNQPGKAKDLLEKVLQINNANVPAILTLAEVEIRLKNLDRAKELYTAADTLIPNNEQIKKRLREIGQEQGEIDTDDPVQKVILEARAKREAGDDKGMLKVLQDGAEKSNYDARIVQALVQLRTNANDVKGAQEIIEKALKVNTNEEQKAAFIKFLKVLSVEDSTLANVQAVELAPNLTNVDKLVLQLGYLTAGGAKYSDQAKAIATELEQKYADQPVVIETLFLRAIREKRMADARKWADLAVAKNIDTFDGATFKSRMLAAEGRKREAVTLMEQGSQRYNYNVEAWRVLAALQSEEGMMAEAVASMQRAVNLRPDDPTSALQYSATLVAAGKNEDALKLMREKAKLLPDSIAVRDEWLRLEGTAGDKEVALKERERDVVRDPANRMYKVQVAALNVDLRRWDEARKRIEEIRATQDGLDIVRIDASRWMDQNNPEAAEKAFRDYIAKVKDGPDGKNKAGEALEALARFMVPNGQPQRAVAALEEARQYQDPKAMQADRMLSEIYLDLAESDKAITTLRRILDASKDAPDDTVRLRLCEALIVSRKFDEADKELQLLGKEASEGAVATLLRADAAGGRGDGKKALEILDKAVAAYPNNAGVFLKRAQASIEQDRNATDILADLDQVIRLDRRLWQAHQLKAVVYQRAGRKEEVINEIRAIMQVDPMQDEMLGLAVRLLVAQDRDDEAVALAEDVAKRRGAPGSLYANLGDLFDAIGRPARAISFYKSAVLADTRTEHVVRYVNALLAQKPPNVTEAESTLTKLQDRINKDPELLLARAGVRKVRNNLVEARRDIAASFKLMSPDQPAAMQQWFTTAFRAMGARDLASTLEGMTKDGINSDWIAFFRARLQADDPTTRTAGIDEMKRVAKSTKIPGLATLASREYSGRLYIAKDFEAASKAMTEIVTADPTDAETLNNLAYMLCKDLNKPAEALPYAKKAYELRPKSPEMIDTFGVVLLANNQLGEAQLVFEKAVSIPSTPSTQVTVLLHMAELQFKQGKRDEAKATMAKARTLFEQVQSITRDIQKEDLDRIEKLIEGP